MIATYQHNDQIPTVFDSCIRSNIHPDRDLKTCIDTADDSLLKNCFLRKNNNKNCRLEYVMWMSKQAYFNNIILFLWFRALVLEFQCKIFVFFFLMRRLRYTFIWDDDEGSFFLVNVESYCWFSKKIQKYDFKKIHNFTMATQSCLFADSVFFSR